MAKGVLDQSSRFLHNINVSTTWCAGLAYLRHDNRGSHTPPFPSVIQKGGVPTGGEKLAVAEAKQVELVNAIVWLPRNNRLAEKRLRELQRSLHYGALFGHRYMLQHMSCPGHLE